MGFLRANRAVVIVHGAEVFQVSAGRGGVVDDEAVVERQCRAGSVEDASAGIAGRIAGYDAVVKFRRAGVVQTAAIGGGVAGQGAADDHQVPGVRPAAVEDASTLVGGVVR